MIRTCLPLGSWIRIRGILARAALGNEQEGDAYRTARLHAPTGDRQHIRVTCGALMRPAARRPIASPEHEKGGRSLPPGAASPSHHDPRIRRGASMTTFPAGEQTHQAVLPQQPALESASADTPGSRDETAHGLPATRLGAVRKHGRGETGGIRTWTRRRNAGSAALAADEAETGSGDAPRWTSNRVFVLARGGEPLMPCHPARARELLDDGRAVVARRAPFTIRLKQRTRADSAVAGVQLRLDPGSKATGIAVTDERRHVDPTGRPSLARRGLTAIELRHRGRQIHGGMRRRAGYRRRRRSANLRYRAPRHDNRSRPSGWLPPSLRHRIDSTLALVSRLCRYAPVLEIHVEHVAFDTAAVAGAGECGARESTGSAHAGCEIREFLLAKWNRSCAYCDATGMPAQHRPRPPPMPWGIRPCIESRPGLHFL
ncbi:RNA-guided endonuclease IscB [Streptomyces sp. NPDC059874]|uniref:RNA-guided endonuclease IscB n=1 Tax=Streptomyces sp. NPDC059874 TaxID=3346983 RepID=UPI00364A2939